MTGKYENLTDDELAACLEVNTNLLARIMRGDYVHSESYNNVQMILDELARRRPWVSPNPV